ncbi:hypothetical protein EN885_01815 [Mesorhizobium sp. M6A.T.Cr.TU.014.01.1.1]|nr:hypothetical protein EOC94_33120 [Mesorhizobium sp. M6A.T.Ce.TU.016.01.1.1]RVB80636.1 hypothetical protein EN885_01815 [Mesorhizobium sp. M6A.T.Cr.TU.014.01.1.1]RWN35893.1 MAG: hypothetical protein EOR95_12975 [Mesorhizobium sp.]RWP39224.1 MAG: hypothetical protein EOR05_34130 [Mesorhizobium sp.]RWQ06494.1 MAG: hypothetical protein EOR91_13740 [Mesorhizobium sp.]
MTQHGKVQPSTAGTQPPATDRRTSMVIIDSDRAAPSRPPFGQHRAEAQRSGLSAFTPELLDGGRAIADICRNPKSP